MEAIVAIIDSGCEEKENMLHYKVVKNEKEGFEVIQEPGDSCGHGSNVAEIIRKLNPDVKILSLAVIESDYSCENEKLLFALEWLAEQVKCDIINISLGIIELGNKEIQRMEFVCKRLLEKGSIILSAYMNEGAISYPACLPYVIGVDMTSALPSINDYIYNVGSCVDVIGKKGLYRGRWDKQHHDILEGTSYVTARLTGMISKWYDSEQWGEEYVREKLKEGAYKVNSFITEHSEWKIEEDAAKVKNLRSAVFPLNKEIQTMLVAGDIENGIKIEIVFDIRENRKVGKKIGDIMLYCNETYKDLVVQNIEQFVELNDIDLFVLGHIEELEGISGRNYTSTIIKICKEKNIPVYSFSDIRYRIKYDNIMIPMIEKEEIPQGRYGKLWSLKTPVLGVFGTGSKEGKFTLQLKLREKFAQEGYEINHLGTEPSSLLCGCDYVFPMGYMSTLNLEVYDTVTLLNEIMHRMDIQDRDLLLVGGQAGCINYLPWNFKYQNIPQSLFLIGTNPDAVILCVNMEDETEVIVKTIQMIESINMDCTVIDLVAFPEVRKLIYGNMIITRHYKKEDWDKMV